MPPNNNPCYGMAVVARLVHMHPQTIRHYERIGLLTPSRTAGKVRMFSALDVQRLEQIHTFTEMGVNLAGVEIIVRLLERVAGMQHELERMRNPPGGGHV